MKHMHPSVVMAAILGATLFLPGNEAVRGSSRVTSVLGTSRPHEEFPFLKHVEASKVLEPAMIQNMTITRAFDLLQKLNTSAPEMLKELQKSLTQQHGQKHTADLISRNLRLTTDPTGAGVQTYSTSTTRALDSLNDLIYEAVEKLDNRGLECDNLKRKGLLELEEIARHISYFYSLAASTAGTILDAQANQNDFGSQLESADQEFADKKADCDTELGSLEDQFRIVSEDLSVLLNMSSMVDCNSSTTTTPAPGTAAVFLQPHGGGLLRCRDPRTNRSWVKVLPRLGAIEAMSKLKSPGARKFISKQGVFVARSSVVKKSAIQGLDEPPQAEFKLVYNYTSCRAFPGGQWLPILDVAECLRAARSLNLTASGFDGQVTVDESPTAAMKFGCVSSNGGAAVGLFHSHVLDDAKCGHEDGAACLCRRELDVNEGQFVTHSQSEIPSDQCALAGSPSCPLIREKFVDITGSVVDSRDNLQQMIDDLNARCTESLTRIETRQSTYHSVLIAASLQLAKAIKEKQTYDTMKKDAEKSKESIQAQYNKNMYECKRDIKNLLDEKCAVKKVRSQMLAMASLPDEVLDCEVSPWSAGLCSKTCMEEGGDPGEQTLSRTEVQPPKNGSHCPPFELKRFCNHQACPIDCEMADWELWGQCTARCGGGVRSRAREISKLGNPQGQPCGETSETIECNSMSCDEDCVLSDWTPWTTECSKPCDGGRFNRIKQETKAAIGEGRCPAIHDPSRYQDHWRCNMQKCPVDAALVCQAKLDVVLVLDGSASLELEGWETIKLAAAKFVKQMSGLVNIGVILFSGPTTGRAFMKCAGLTNKLAKGEEWNYDQATDCDMEWKAHLPEEGQEQNSTQILGNISDMVWPKGPTFTSMALREAMTELNRGRADAKKAVVIFTDGLPYSQLAVKEQSADLMQSATVVWVPTGPKVPEDISVFEEWASRPVEDHVVKVAELDHLVQESVMNAIIADFCPDALIYATGKVGPEYATGRVGL